MNLASSVSSFTYDLDFTHYFRHLTENIYDIFISISIIL